MEQKQIKTKKNRKFKTKSVKRKGETKQRKMKNEKMSIADSSKCFIKSVINQNL